MSLSFREQAALVLLPRTVTDRDYFPSDAIQDAQSFAEGCCLQWSHDWADTVSPVMCQRCGRERGVER